MHKASGVAAGGSTVSSDTAPMKCIPLLLFVLCSTLSAADVSAANVVARQVQARAERVAGADPALAADLRQLAAGISTGGISLSEAHAALAIFAVLPNVGAGPTPRANSTYTQPALPAPLTGVPAAAVTAVLDGAAPNSGAAAANPVQPTGEVLAIEPGADGNPALIAVSIGQLHGVREGQRIAITRDGATIVLARANQVRDDMTIALLIPSTWHGDTKEIKVGDVAIVIAP